MEYDKQIAIELQKKYSLPEATVRTWKHRGSIPDHWAGEDDPRDRAEEKDQRRVIEIISLPEIKYSAFTSITKAQFNDVKRYSTRKDKSASFTRAEIIAFKSEVVRLRNFLRKFMDAPSEKKILEIFKEHRIKHYLLFRECRKMVNRMTAGGSGPTDEEMEKCKVAVAALYNALNF